RVAFGWSANHAAARRGARAGGTRLALAGGHRTPGTREGGKASAMNHAKATDSLLAGKYEVLEEIPRTDACVGYKVRHAQLGSLLFVTAMPADLVGCLDRVRAAAREASQLRHDHILPVLDVVEEAERLLVVEPFVDAMSLDRVIRETPLAPPDALHVARQL